MQTCCKHYTIQFRCEEKCCCEKSSVKTSSVVACSKLGYQNWVTPIFLASTCLKDVSSMKFQ